jgi:hypothetical protein
LKAHIIGKMKNIDPWEWFHFIPQQNKIVHWLKVLTPEMFKNIE